MRQTNFIKIICFLSATCIALGTVPVKAEIQPDSSSQPPSISASAAIVVDALRGATLYEQNADSKLSMASTTKIMTALLTIESGELDRTVTTTKEMVTIEGTSMGLKEGDTVTLEGLCYGMLLSSGNDAANTAAIAVSGSIAAFVDLMNKKAAEIGMENTSFATPSGLDSETHYSTARDMALLSCYALRNETFKKIASTESIKISYGNPPYRRTLTNHNKMLYLYEGTVGVKTGFTKKSGRCLVSAAERNQGRLVCVTLNDPDDWNDHKSLLDYGLSKLENVTLYPPENLLVPVTGGECDEIQLTAEPLSVSISKDLADNISCSVLTQPLIYAPVYQNKAIGELVFLCGQNEIARCLLYPSADIPQKQYIPPQSGEFLYNLKRLLTE